ncbi:MAG TPA: DUF1801 domain-containing protein [Candidatus Krumholzibacteria bacterium]
MPESKTGPTKTTLAAYLASISDEGRREDCRALAKIMARVTGKTATIWGGTIVGFGKYHYRYESGHEGDTCLAGFSSRKGDISLYLFPVFPEKEALLGKLGKHKAGKGCVYIRRMEDVDAGVLEKLITASIREIRKRYPA